MKRATHQILSVAATAILGCGRVGYDWASGGSDGGLPAPESCSSLEEGAPCDDRNICTSTSSCVGGVCTPSAPSSSCTVADSRGEFGDSQGESEWWYGYWHAEVDPDGAYDPDEDFLEMAYFEDGGAWRPPDYEPDEESPGFTWAYLAPYWEHPGGAPRALKLPVRRWVSDVQGPAAVDIRFSMSDTSGGDGTIKILMVDGTEVWRHHAPGDDGAVASESIDVELQVGTRVDFLLDPVEHDARDTSNFEVVVRSP